MEKDTQGDITEIKIETETIDCGKCYQELKTQKEKHDCWVCTQIK